MNRTINEAKALLEKELELVRRVTRSIARRKQLRNGMEEDFESYVMVKLVENDYARLRKFRDQSSLATYLTVVVQRLYSDFQRNEFGKWRPSVAAKSMGKLGVQLEQYISRDGLSFDEAYQKLGCEGFHFDSRDELWQKASRLPVRVKRRLVGPEPLASLASPERAPALVERKERENQRSRLEDAIRDAISHLPAQHALVLRLWFRDGCTAPKIARLLSIRQRAVYSMVGRGAKSIRNRLTANGLDKDAVLHLCSGEGLELSELFEDKPGN